MRRALDPLPDEAPAAVAYRPPALASMAAHQQALLDELEAVAMATLPGWLPESEAIESAGGAARAVVRDLSAKPADALGISSRYLADLAERALRGGSWPRTGRYPPAVRAVGVARTLAAAFGRERLVLLVDPQLRAPRPADRRTLLDALEWFSYQAHAGVWLTGRPPAEHLGRIPVVACPVSPTNDLRTSPVSPGPTATSVASTTAAARRPTAPLSRHSPPARPAPSAAPVSPGASAEPRPPGPFSPAAPETWAQMASPSDHVPAATTPALRGRPHPASRAEQRLESALSQYAWAHGRVWNQPHRSGPLSALIYVDLAWFAERVVVEVDGPEHRGMAHYESDRWRDNDLELEGFALLRFTNDAVLGDVDLVLHQIERCITARRTPSEEEDNP
jgi:very-short-patch-repair endonuclease